MQKDSSYYSLKINIVCAAFNLIVNTVLQICYPMADFLSSQKALHGLQGVPITCVSYRIMVILGGFAHTLLVRCTSRISLVCV